MERYPPLPHEDMNRRQRDVVAAVSQRRKPSVSSQGGVEGPFVPLVYVPGILDHMQFLGEHCRFHTSLSPKLREFAIIIAARHVAAPLEFHVHAMEAREFGLAEETISAIAAQRRPAVMDLDETLLHDFCTSIYSDARVSDSLFEQCARRFGKSQIIELLATCGYYAMLGFGMNATHPAVPKFLEGFEPAFPVPQE